MKTKRLIGTGVKLLLALLVAAWSGFPILLVLISSFKRTADIFEFPPRFVFMPTLDNYVTLYREWPEFFGKLFNSLVITIGATLLTLVVTTMAGYVYSRYRNRLLTTSAFFMIVIRMLPPIIITIPLFPALNYLGLIDTHILLIVLYSTFYVSLSTWIMKACIDQIPRSMEEAAFVDGASLTQTLTLVTLPLALQGVLAAAVFVLAYSWNEFLFAFIFTSSNAKTAPLIISEMLGSVTGVNWGPLFAAATLQIVPILVFVIAMQKYLVAGLTAGATKE